MSTSAFLEELREATRAAHRALDARAGMDAHVTRERYVAFLHGSLAALERVEPAVSSFESTRREPEPRSRAECLQADLRELGVTLGDSRARATPLAELMSEAGAAGATYVVEGSTLGGVVMARHVDAALDLCGRAQSYLRYRGERTGEAWRRSVALLTSFGERASDEQRRSACDAARAVFALYEHALDEAGALNR